MWFQKPPLGTPLNWENPLNDELAMHLAMNEGHGDYLADLSMNSNHGTLKNFAYPPTIDSGWNPGKSGVTMKYNNTDNTMLEMPALGIVNSPFTIALYVYPLGTGSYRTLIGYNGENRILIPADGMLLAQFDGNLTSAGAGDVPDGKWSHIAYVFTGTHEMFYINGHQSGSSHATQIPEWKLVFWYGQYTGVSGSYPHCGAIDQPRILNRAYTAKEVLDYSINPWSVYLDEDD